MMNPQVMLNEFLDRLMTITDEELLAGIQKAREDSRDSYLFDEERSSERLESDSSICSTEVVYNPTLTGVSRLVFVFNMQNSRIRDAQTETQAVELINSSPCFASSTDRTSYGIKQKRSEAA